jgi:SP family facilitated glucose transporter-like MFS transporter 8
MKREHNSFSDKINKYITIYRNFFTPPVLKPFVIILVFNVVQPLCGHTLFMFYAVDILSRIKRTDTEIMNENHETVLLSSVRVFFVTLSSFCLFRYGRRQIGVISGIGASLSGIFIASILYLNTLDRDSPIPPQIEAWLTFLIITLFVGSHSFGFYMLPPLMIGETQPAHVRSYLCGCIYTINDLIFGSVVKSYPLIVRSVDVHGMFLIFGMSCLICTIFIYLFLPETQGKSLMEIEDYFRGKNIMWISRNNNCNDNGDVFATRQRQK